MSLHISDFGCTELVNKNPIDLKKVNSQIENWTEAELREKRKAILRAEKFEADLGYCPSLYGRL